MAKLLMTHGDAVATLPLMPRKSAETIPNATGPDLRGLRMSHGWTLDDIGNMGGPTKSYLARVELGTLKAGDWTLYKLARATGLQVEVWRMAYSVTRQQAVTQQSS